MRHQISGRKLNLGFKHRRAFVRNQAMCMIENGHITTTLARAKHLRGFVERVVTLAKKGKSYGVARRVNSLLPYKSEVLDILFKDIAPRYVDRPGGYTRVIRLGRRVSDTAEIARLEWV